MSINYFAIFHDLMKRRGELASERNALEIEIGRVTQLIQATFPLLSPEQQQATITAMQRIEDESLGLKAAVRIVLATNKSKWATPPEIRDRIKDLGIPLDLGSNPLASIATTLKRMVPSEAETKVLDGGQIAYRRRPTLGDRIAEGIDEGNQRIADAEPKGIASLQRRPRHTVADLPKNPPGSLGKK